MGYGVCEVDRDEGNRCCMWWGNGVCVMERGIRMMIVGWSEKSQPHAPRTTHDDIDKISEKKQKIFSSI